MPEYNLGSNQVDFGGMVLFSSAISINSSINVGNIPKATPFSNFLIFFLSL